MGTRNEISMHEHLQREPSVNARYGERKFTALPDSGEATRLLRELAGGTCGAWPQKPRRPLVLYGGGDLGRMANDYFRGLGYQVDQVIDRNAAALAEDSFWRGVQVIHPDQVPEETKQSAQLVLCIATISFKQLERELQAVGWTDIVPFYDLAESLRHRHPLANGWFAEPLSEQDLLRTTDVLARWDDDLSRAHHLQFLAWRMLREEWTFAGAPVNADNRFFIPEVLALSGLENFVDAGSHHGHVTRKFAELKGADAKSIIAIEPDPRNVDRFETMRDDLPTDISDKIVVLPVALGVEGREGRFHHGLGYMSQFADSGRCILRSTSIDSLGLEPDFLKLHLEGAEYEVLCGAVETIRRHRPVLAVTTYHNADGIWRTPAWMMNQLDDYRYLMRLHSWCGTGAVVYAIPAEKA